MEEERWIDAKELAEALGIKAWAVYRMVNARLIPFEELPKQPWHTSDRRQLRFQLSAVKAAIQSRTSSSK